MAIKTFSRVAGLTPGLLLMTRETVPIPTPAARATSWIVIAILLEEAEPLWKRFQLLNIGLLFEDNIPSSSCKETPKPFKTSERLFVVKASPP